MYVGLKQPRGDGERYVTPARAAAKETRFILALVQKRRKCPLQMKHDDEEKWTKFLDS